VSRTSQARVILGVLCDPSDFYAVTGTERACANGHRSRAAYCPKCGSEVAEVPVETPTAAFAPYVGKGERPSAALRGLVSDDERTGIHDASRYPSNWSRSTPDAYLVGLEVVEVNEYVRDTGAPLAVEPTEEQRAHVARLAEGYGVGGRPIRLFLQLVVG
jgi:hypothetical protein